MLKGVGLAAAGAALAACQPQTVVVKEEVPVTQIVKETIKETVIVEGTPQVVEKEVTKVVEKQVTRVVAATPAPPEPVVLEVWHWDEFEEQVVDICSDIVQEKTDGMVSAKAVIIPSNQEYNTKGLAAMAAGTPPDCAQFEMLPTCMYGGLLDLMPLYDRDRAECDAFWDYDVAIEPQIWRGGLYAVFESAAGWGPIAFYNVDLFEQYGEKTPGDYLAEDAWDWNAYLSVAEAMTIDENGDGTPDIFGTNGLGLTWTSVTMPFIESANGKFFDAAYETVLLDSPETKSALQFQLETKKYAPAGFGVEVPGGAESGKIAMWHSWPTGAPNYPETLAFNWMPAPLLECPDTGKAQWGWLYHGGKVIPSGTRHREEAWTFFKVWNGDVGQTARFNAAFIVPGRKVISEELLMSVPSMKGIPEQAPLLADYFLKAGEKDYFVMPFLSNWWEMQSEITAEWSLLWTGDQSMDETMDKVVAILEKLLAKAEKP
jgi:multiple sugar transport system substrate-binding protein